MADELLKKLSKFTKNKGTILFFLKWLDDNKEANFDNFSGELEKTALKISPPNIRTNIVNVITAVIVEFMNKQEKLKDFIKKFENYDQSNSPTHVPITVPVQTNSVISGCDEGNFISCICEFDIKLIQLYIDFLKILYNDILTTVNDIFDDYTNYNSLDRDLLNKYVDNMSPSTKQNTIKKTIDEFNECIINKLKIQICEKLEKTEKFKYLQYIHTRNSTNGLDSSIMTAIDNLRSQDQKYIDNLFTAIIDCIQYTDVESMLCLTKQEHIDDLIKFLTELNIKGAFNVGKPGFMGEPLFEELRIYKLKGQNIQTLINHVERNCREKKRTPLNDRICKNSNEIRLNYIKVIDNQSVRQNYKQLQLDNQICNEIWLDNTNRKQLRNDIINCLTEKQETSFIDTLCKSGNIVSSTKFLSDLINNSSGNINNYVALDGYSNLPSDDIKETLIILKLKNKTTNLTDLLKNVIKCYICETTLSDIRKLECIKYLCSININGNTPTPQIKTILDLYDDKQELIKYIITCFSDDNVKSTEICENESITYDIANIIFFMDKLRKLDDNNITEIVKNEYPKGYERKIEIVQKLQIYRLKNKNAGSPNMQKLINDVVECYVCNAINDNSKKLDFIRHLCGINIDKELELEERNILNAYENSAIKTLKDKIISCLKSPDYGTLSNSLCDGNTEQDYVHELIEFLGKLQVANDECRIFDIEKPQQMDKDIYKNLIICKLKEPNQIQQLINYVRDTCIKCKPTDPTDPTRPKVPELKDLICCETDPIKKFGYIRYIGDKREDFKRKYVLTPSICSQIDKFAGNTGDLINHIVKCTVLPPMDTTKVCDDVPYFTKFVKFIYYLISASGVDTKTMFAKAIELGLDEFDQILYPFVLEKLKNPTNNDDLVKSVINIISDCYCNKHDVYQVLEFIEYLDGNTVNIPERLSGIKEVVDKYKLGLRNYAIECLRKDTTITAPNLITEICDKFIYAEVNRYIDFINSLSPRNASLPIGTDEIEKKIKILYLKGLDLKSTLIPPICVCLKGKVIGFICTKTDKVQYYIDYLKDPSKKNGTDAEIIKVIDLIKKNSVPFTDSDILSKCKPPSPPPPPPPPKNVDVNELSTKICDKFSDYNTVKSYIEFITKNPIGDTAGDQIKEDIKSLSTTNSTEFNKLLGLVCKCLKDKIIKAVCASGQVKSYIDYLNDNSKTDGTEPNIINFIELLKIPNCDPLTVDDLKNEPECIKPETPPPPKNVDIDQLSKDICDKFPDHDKVKEYLEFIKDTTQPPNGDPIKEDIKVLSTTNPTDFPQLLQKVCDCLREAIVTAICDTTKQQSYIDYLNDKSKTDGTEPNIINFIELLNEHCNPLTEGEITAKCAPLPTPPPPTPPPLTPPPPPVKVISGDSASYVTDQEIVYIHKKDNTEDVIYEYEGPIEDRAIRQVRLNGHDVEVMDNGKWTKVDLTNFKRLYPKTNMISNKTTDLFNEMVFTAKAVFDLIAPP